MKPTDRDELVIFRNEQRAGVLSRTENGCQFTFAPEFLASSAYTELSYGIPKTKSPLVIHGTNLPPFFAGLLPEGLRLKALVRNIKTSQDDLFSLFAAAGSHVIGDVYASVPASTKLQSKDHRAPARPPKLKDIDFYEHFQDLLSKDSYSLGEDALSGVQEKISASMISFPLNIAKATKAYILKLNPRDKPNLVENELCCMTLASRCGIETPAVKIVRDKNKNVGLMVERFDRIWNNETTSFKMIHQEDACQFLGRYPADKYNLSFSQIAAGIQQFTTASQASLLKLLRLFSFCYLIGNGDLHAKNISLFTHPSQHFVDLTPAYDLLTTYIYSDFQMAVMFDEKKDNYSRKMIVHFGERFGVNERATNKMLDKLTKDMNNHKDLLQSIPMKPTTATNLEKLVGKRLKDLA